MVQLQYAPHFRKRRAATCCDLYTCTFRQPSGKILARLESRNRQEESPRCVSVHPIPPGVKAHQRGRTTSLL